MAADNRVHLEGIYSHLPFEGEAGRDWAAQRYTPFRDVLAGLADDGIEPDVTQIWGTSGLLAGLPDVSNTVCVGQALYGLVAASEDTPAEFAPVLAGLTARVVHIGRHPTTASPTTISPAPAAGYGCGPAARTAVLAFGIADGMRRPAAGRPMHALVRGRPVPIVGVTLEHTVLDLDGLDGDVGVGEEVVLIGGFGPDAVTLSDWRHGLAAAGSTLR